MKLGGKEIDVPIINWGESKKLAVILGEGFAGNLEQLKKMAQGKDGITELFTMLPEIMTKALALCLRTHVDEIDRGSLEEILDLIPEVLKVNKFLENFEKIKNLMGSKVAPILEPMDLKKAEKEVLEKLGVTKPQLSQSLQTASAGRKKKRRK